MKLKILFFLQTITKTIKKPQDLEEKFSNGEFKLETLKLMSQINVLKGKKNTIKSNFLDKHYQKVIFSEIIIRTQARKILELTLPDLADENFKIQDKQTGSNV